MITGLFPPARLWLLHLAALMCFIGLAFLALNPLMLDPGGLVTAGPLNDYHLFHWNQWWLRHALFDLGADPYYTDYILFPLRNNLSMHTLAPILAPPYWVLQPLVGDPAAMNLILFGAFALNGYLAFVFLRCFTGSTSWAMIGGILWALLPGTMSHVVNYHANMWLMAWLPALLLLWERVSREGARASGQLRRRLTWAVGFGVALWGLWLTDLQFLLWIMCLLAPYGLYTLLRPPSWPARARIAGAAVLALVVMLALAAIAPLPAILAQAPGSTSPARYETARYHSLPLDAYLFMPGPEDRSLGRALISLTVLAVLVISVPAFRRHSLSRSISATRPGRWFWLLVALPPLMLALGPDTEIAGTTVALPYRWLHDALSGLYRFPSRFAPVGALALLVFIGLSLAPALSRQNRRSALLACGLTFLIAVDLRLLTPLPVQAPLRPYAVHSSLGADVDDYVILEVPLTVHSGWMQVGGADGHRTMLYQATHRKRQVNGSLSRIPDIYHVLFMENPLLGWMSGSRPPDPPAAAEELSRLIAEWPVGAVLIYQGWLDSTDRLSLMAFINGHPDLCFDHAERDLLLYRARSRGCPPPATLPYTLDFGTDIVEAWLLEGWYPAETIGGPEGRWMRSEAGLVLRLVPERDHMLTISGLGFGPNQHVRLHVADHEIGRIDLPEHTWTEHTIRLPGALIPSSGVVHIRLSAARERVPGLDTRMLAAAFRWLRVEGM